MNIEILLTGLSWFGAFFAVAGSWMLGKGNMNGWRAFIVADTTLIGIQIYAHIWSQVALFSIFLLLGVRGLIKTGQLLPTWKDRIR